MKSTCEWPWSMQQRGEVGGDLGLRAAREAHLDDLLEARVGGRAGGGEALELVGVLDRAQHRQRGGHRDVARAGQRLLEAEQLQRPRRVRDRVAPVRVEQRRDGRVRVVCRRSSRSARSCPRSARASASGRSRTGRIIAGSRPFWSASSVEPLGDRHRRVAGEVERGRARARRGRRSARPRRPARPRAPCAGRSPRP